MTSAVTGRGSQLAKALIDALGLKQVQKLVVEAEVGDVVIVYVKAIVTQEQDAAMAQAVKLLQVEDVSVANDCTVTAVGADPQVRPTGLTARDD